MAEATTSTPPTVDANSTQCGYCLRRDTEMVYPKQLSCSHVHCLECLTEACSVNSVVRCPTCRKVYDVSLDSLPSVFIPESTTYCDICRQGKENKEPAVVYCTSCCKTYCTNHLNLHDALEDDHPKITVNEYRAKATQFKPRTCTEHTDQIYSLGCKSCHSLFCLECTSGGGNCANELPHQLISIDELASELHKALNELKVKTTAKERELSSLLKETSSTLSEYDMKTIEMVNEIHQTRDAQLNAITLAYKELEEGLIACRNNTQYLSLQFLEKELDEKLSSLYNQRLRIEARLKDRQQVDIIVGYDETRDRIKKLIAEEFPKLHLNGTVKLCYIGECRDPELRISACSLHLVKQISVGYDDSYCSAICQYGGKTYVGMKNCVHVIDEKFNLTENLIRYRNDKISYIAACDDRLYILPESWNRINVHDLEGNLQHQWECGSSLGEFAIIDKQLVVPCASPKTLSVYSLAGELVRQVVCPLLQNGGVSLCSAVGRDVIINSEGTIFRMNLDSEEIKWTITENTLPQPSFLACYSQTYIFVCTEVGGAEALQTIDLNTGKVRSQFDLQGDGQVLDISISGGTLAVLREDYDIRDSPHYVDIYRIE